MVIPATCKQHPARALAEAGIETGGNRMDKKILDEINALNEKRTPGEWHSHKPEKSNGYIYIDDEYSHLGTVATCYTRSAEADAAYIVACCNAAPALVAEIEQLNQKIDAADHLLESISLWLWKNTGIPDPMWIDQYKLVCNLFEPKGGEK
jgi:hypothetical protein